MIARRRTKPHPKGAALTEYAILAALVAILVIAAVAQLGTQVKGSFETSREALAISDKTETGGASEQEQVNPFVRQTSDTVIMDSDTSLVLTNPPETVAGDLLVAVVAHRSMIAAPAGWSKEFSQKIVNQDHWLTVFSKPAGASSASASEEFSQGAANRFLGQIYAIGGTNPRVANYDTLVGDTEERSTPDYYLASSAALIISAATDWSLTPAPITTTVSGGWLLTTPATRLNNRLSIAHRQPSGAEGAMQDGAVFLNDSSAENNWASATFQITTDGVGTVQNNPYSVAADPRVTSVEVSPGTWRLYVEGELICAPSGFTYVAATDEWTVPGLITPHTNGEHGQDSGNTFYGPGTTTTFRNTIPLEIRSEYAGRHPSYGYHYWGFTYHLEPGQLLPPGTEGCIYYGG